MREKYVSPKYDGDAFAGFLYQLSLDRSWLDDEQGSVTDEGYWIGRIGRHILYESDQGFVDRYSFETADAAVEEMGYTRR